MSSPLIDKLFRVTADRKFTLRGQTVHLYLRTIGAVDDAARNDYAVAASRKLLRKLRDTQSPEFLQYLDLDGVSREDMVEQTIMLKRPQFWRDAAVNAYREVDPEPPDNPTITEVVEAAEETERLDLAVEDERAQYVKDATEEFRQELEAMDEIDLMETLRMLRTDSLLNGTYVQASNAYTIFAATYCDRKYTKRYFSDPSEASNSDPQFLEELLAYYMELDVFAQRSDELKK